MVPKENRLDIGKCNGRIPSGLKPKEETFQVVLDALALTPCYPAFIIIADVPEICLRVQGRDFDALPSEEETLSFLRDLGHNGVINSLNDVVIDQMHQPWRTFAAIINRSLSGKTSGLDKLCLSRAQILWGMYHQKYVDYVELLWEDFTYQIDNKVYKKQEKINKIGMHTSKDDYLINTLRFVSRKEASQIYEAVLPECLTSPEMKESKAYKTYLGHATGVVPPKIPRKFKKASSTKKDSDLVPIDEEPVTKGKQVKRSVKNSSTNPTTGIVIRESPVETKSKGKEKEKVDVACGAKKPPSVEKTTPTITSEGTGDKPGVPDVTEDDSIESESESWGNDEDDSNDEQESKDKSSEQENESKEQESDDSEQEDESNDDNQEEEEVDQENEFKDDEIQIDEDKGMYDTTNQFNDDVDSRLEEPTQTGNENLETTQEQVVEDAHVTISTVTKKTEVSATSSSCSSDLASKFLNFSDIPHTDAEIISPFDIPIQHEVPNTQTTTLLPIHVSVITNIPLSLQTFTPPPLVITTLEKEVAEIKKDPLHTQVTYLVDEHLDTRLGETREEFINFLSESLTARIKEQVKDQLPQILPKKVSNFAPPVIEKLIKESRDEVTLEKIEKSESYLTATEHRDCYDGLKKSYALDKDFFYSYDVYSLKRGRKDNDKDEDPSAGSNRGLKKRKTSKDEEPTTCLKKKYSTSGSSKGTKSQPKSSRKSVQSEEPVFEVADSDLPQDQEGNLGDNKDELRNETAYRRPTQNWLITLAASTSTDKSLKDFDKLMRTQIDFSSYVLNGLKIKNLTQEILLGPAFRLLKGIRSNYAELEYDFKECYKAFSKKLDWEKPEGGDYPFDLSKPLPLIMRRNLTHVKVMRKHRYGYLEEIAVRRANNILYRFKEGDDVADFAIALRMFTRSLVIQKRVEDLQLGVKSYQKKINVTKPDTTRLDLRKRHSHYQEYRHRVLAEEKMEHIRKERAHFMIKDNNKMLKERRMMRSLEKFIGVRHRYSNPIIQPEPEGSTQGYPLDSVEVLRYDTKEEKVDPQGFEGTCTDGDGEEQGDHELVILLKKSKAESVEVLRLHGHVYELETAATTRGYHVTELGERLNALDIEFDMELFPNMLKAMAGTHRGLEDEVFHGKVGRGLEDIEVYDVEVEAKYTDAVKDL
ncbi:hypothetical protein Tco_1506756 [Tanacetum coccineum]